MITPDQHEGQATADGFQVAAHSLNLKPSARRRPARRRAGVLMVLTIRGSERVVNGLATIDSQLRPGRSISV
jgi:hypothetical protein